MDKKIPFYKYHGLGNDYIVIDPRTIELDGDAIRRICHRNYGVGSDGILYGPAPRNGGNAGGDPFALRIYNPDGSEAEKSGNGLRIFARYLWDSGQVKNDPFKILTAGGEVSARVHPGGRMVDVEMGRVSFHSEEIPVTGSAREVVSETLQVGDDELTICAATIGNPHCVVVQDDISEQMARRWGPGLETHSWFPNRTNVQFMKIIDRANIQIEIWERGAGYTLASGSSSSAAAAVARKLGHCDDAITVHMPGGVIEVQISDTFDISMRGPVTHVADGHMDSELFE